MVLMVLTFLSFININNNSKVLYVTPTMTEVFGPGFGNGTGAANFQSRDFFSIFSRALISHFFVNSDLVPFPDPCLRAVVN